MDRENFIKIVEKKIESENINTKDKKYIEKNYKQAKNGIYFLYDKNEKVIYVGKVGNGKSTSFYDRMYGHGNGAHCNKTWFNEVKKFKFKSFPNLEDDELIKIERLMIYAKKQPIYNYIIKSEQDFITISKKI